MPNFAMLVRRLVQAALVGAPYEVRLHWSGLKARAEDEKSVKAAAARSAKVEEEEEEEGMSEFERIEKR